MDFLNLFIIAYAGAMSGLSTYALFLLPYMYITGKRLPENIILGPMLVIAIMVQLAVMIGMAVHIYDFNL